MKFPFLLPNPHKISRALTAPRLTQLSFSEFCYILVRIRIKSILETSTESEAADDEVEAVVECSSSNVNGGRDVDVFLGTTVVTLHVTARLNLETSAHYCPWCGQTDRHTMLHFIMPAIYGGRRLYKPSQIW